MRIAISKLKRLGNGLHVVRQLGRDGLFKVTGPATAGAGVVRSALSNIRSFQYVEPNNAVWLQDFSTPDDPFYPQQYPLNNTGVGTAVAVKVAPLKPTNVFAAPRII